MPTRNINLTEHDDQFVAEQIGAGRYKNASEVLRAELRLLEQQTQPEKHDCEDRSPSRQGKHVSESGVTHGSLSSIVRLWNFWYPRF